MECFLTFVDFKAVIQDNQNCSSMFGFQKYCYQFEDKTIIQNIIKIGCSATLCAVKKYSNICFK